LTTKNLEVKITWPKWFVAAEQIAAFTADDEGNIQFPPEHQMTMDMAKCNQEMEEEDGRVYDYVYFQFRNDMVQEIVTFELLDVIFNGSSINCLQFYIKVAAGPVNSRARGVTHARRVNLGTGCTPTNNPNTRTSSEHEEDANNSNTNNGNDETGDTAMGGTGGTGTNGFFWNVCNQKL
jgi:hypothetical protein